VDLVNIVSTFKKGSEEIRLEMKEGSVEKMAKATLKDKMSSEYGEGFLQGFNDGYYSLEKTVANAGRWFLLWPAVIIPLLVFLGWYFKIFRRQRV
jgi:hypothetical protein